MEIQSSTKATLDQRANPLRWSRNVQIGAAIILALGLSLGIWLGLGIDQNRQFPSSIRRAVSFQLYYPSKAPAGWSVDRSSFSAGSGVVTFTVTNEKSQRFLVSLQQLPTEFNYPAFEKKFFDTDEYNVEAGSVFIGELGNTITASIRTPEGSWIIISDPDTNTRSQLEALTRYFTKA